jgi:hypothetical protein
LAQAYLAAGVVSPNYADDARHVAIATVEQVGLVVSWKSNIWRIIKEKPRSTA